MLFTEQIDLEGDETLREERLLLPCKPIDTPVRAALLLVRDPPSVRPTQAETGEELLIH